MLESFFQGIFDTHYVSVIDLSDFLLCLGVSLVIGLMLAGCAMFRSRYTKSFVVTLAVLPAVVCVVIMMVNGNVGAGVAVAGAFSLVRFRSVPGTPARRRRKTHGAAQTSGCAPARNAPHWSAPRPTGRWRHPHTAKFR